MRTVLLGVVERNALLQVFASRGKRTQTVQGCPQGEMAHKQECGVLLVLGHSEELLSQFPRGLVLRPHDITCRQAPQHLGQLLGIPHLLTERSRPAADR